MSRRVVQVDLLECQPSVVHRPMFKALAKPAFDLAPASHVRQQSLELPEADGTLLGERNGARPT